MLIPIGYDLGSEKFLKYHSLTPSSSQPSPMSVLWYTARVSGGVAAAGLVLTLPISSVVISGAVTVVVTMAAVEGVERVWGELPDGWTDTLDESIADGWDDLKDATGDVAGKVWSWVS